MPLHAGDASPSILTAVDPAADDEPGVGGWLTRRRLLVLAGALSLLTVITAAIAWMGADLDSGEVFDWLYARHELPGACLALALLVLAPWGSRWLGGAGQRLAATMARRPWVVVAVTAAGLAVGSATVYSAFPLSMDEYAPVFQARVFAAGHLAARWPPDLLPWLLPPRAFFPASGDGRVIESYWPGQALLLTPFARLRAEWLLGPLLTAGSVCLLMALARRLHPEDEAAPGWVALLALASPGFTITGISYYSMSAHLFANLLFAWLLSALTRPRALLAGAVGGLALALHHPLPHLLVGAPWVLWTALRHERRPLLAPLLAGYLAVGLPLVVWWPWWKLQLQATDPLQPPPPFPFPFHLPTLQMLWVRLLEYLKLADWAVPGLLVLAAWGVVLCRRHRSPAARELAGLLAASACCLLAGFFGVTWQQGHGWSYRHFHAAWGVLPLFGATPMLRPVADRARWAALVGFLALGSLGAGTSLRAVEVHRFSALSRHQLPATPAARPLVCFVVVERRYFFADLVRNDPFLRDDVLLLASHGRELDDALRARRFPGARSVLRTSDETCWQFPRSVLPSLRVPAVAP